MLAIWNKFLVLWLYLCVRTVNTFTDGIVKFIYITIFLIKSLTDIQSQTTQFVNEGRKTADFPRAKRIVAHDSPYAMHFGLFFLHRWINNDDDDDDYNFWSSLSMIRNAP